MTTNFTSFTIPLMRDNNVRPLAMLSAISFISDDIRQNTTKDVLQNFSGYGIPVLIDTGAIIPIWTGNLKLLLKFGATFYKSNVPFSGFGGIVYGDAYNLPDLYIGNLHFKDIKIVASSTLGNVPFFMIISATMFRGLAYEIDMIDYNLNIRMKGSDNFERKLLVYSKTKDSYENLSLYL